MLKLYLYKKFSPQTIMFAQTCAFRSAIVLGMFAAVLTVLYFTPLPDEYYISCDRPCNELDWPMICRVKLNLEMYRTLYCENCSDNTVNGVYRSVYSANRQLPGPAIQVCENDIMVVDVVNNLPGQSVAIHWRGQPQDETPFMDGVPMVTQCPISSYTTFQYKFRAAVAGTHLWHAYSGEVAANGIFGALIVRQPDKLNPQLSLYDYDEKDHVFVISRWRDHLTIKNKHKLLVNGRANGNMFSEEDDFLPAIDLTLEPKKRYRFRMAYVPSSESCSINISVDKHLLKVISLDGHAIVPRDVASIEINNGERVDFVLATNYLIGVYDLTIKTINCVDRQELETKIAIQYQGAESSAGSSEKSSNKRKQKQLTTNLYCESVGGNICVDTVQSVEKMPIVLRDYSTKKKYFMAFGTISFFDYGHEASRIMHMNNFTFTFPSSPLLTQFNEINHQIMCNPKMGNHHQCRGQSLANHICECLYMEHIPIGETVEIILLNQDEDIDHHMFHMHGYSFWVVGARQFPGPISLDEVKELDHTGMLFNRNLLNPVRKDTITVRKFGAVALRFKADNPGYWILREEHSATWSRGADVLFQVGNYQDYLAPPTDYPRCGNFIGPEFFLM